MVRPSSRTFGIESPAADRVCGAQRTPPPAEDDIEHGSHRTTRRIDDLSAPAESLRKGLLQARTKGHHMGGNEPAGGRILGSLRSADGEGVVRMEDRFDTDTDDVWSALTDSSRL